MGSLLKRRAQYVSAMGYVLAIALSILAPNLAGADDSHLAAQHLSDSSFAVLNSLTSDSSKAGAGEVKGAMASFAGDAQTLSTALAKGDQEGAGAAMKALIADRRAVDEALLKNPGAIDSSKWAPLKAELASIQSRIPEASGSVAKASPAESHPGVV